MSNILNLKENIIINLNYDKAEFLKRFKKIVDFDRGILKDELYKSVTCKHQNPFTNSKQKIELK